jgi:hypothetical protein
MNNNPFPIRFRPNERAALKELSERLYRSEADTVRVLVMTTLETLKERDHNERSAENTPAV